MIKIGNKVMLMPGIDSFKGRYLYLALLFSFSLLIIAYIGYSNIEQASQLLLTSYQHITGEGTSHTANQQLAQLNELIQQTLFWIILITTAAILLISYFYILSHRLILKPLTETINAIQQGGESSIELSLPQQPASETRHLVEALRGLINNMESRHSKLDHMAHHDALTGLPNRTLFRDRLVHALHLSERQNHLLSVMFLDLDGFKYINDSLGHAVGDQLLIAVAERLRITVRESDTVARLGGDEFAILLEFFGDHSEASKMAEKILLAFKPPFILNDQEFYISTSIGVALSPTDDTNSDRLIQAADAAMYEAKRAGKGTYRFYAKEMTEHAVEHLELENRLRQAVIAGEFEFHFSAIAKTDNLQIEGYEALLRWRKSDQEILSPESFLRQLEETGLMAQVVEQLLEDVIEMQAAFRTYGAKDLFIAVNLSPSFLINDHQSIILLSELISGRLSPHQLMLEVTEEALAKKPEIALETLNKLKALGVRIALDDFGVGQSSLSHLRRFPFDVVKIDREFVRDVAMDENDANLAKAVIQLGHAFNIEVIGEGVENSGQLDFLRKHHCDSVQGYLLSYPITKEEVLNSVRTKYQAKEQ
ncbi:MAG: EAL domain-containing protein [Candidatus Polarisedimenticolaceae bacterium]|nr:EAL domain-containing protein [Candidatus Polarisedimenticolaceae bacterium]